MTRGPRAVSAGPAAVDLRIDGMTCASCVRRVERRLNALEGVEASVNLPLASAHVETDGTVTVEDLVAAVEKAGYSAAPEPSGDADSDDDGDAGPDGSPHAPAASALKPRLIVAAALTVPIVAMSMVPGLGFPGSAWVVAALTAPVATWAAWPFHRAAAVNARHGGSTMDTLVSLGVTVAFVSSLVALVTSGGGLAQSAGHGGLGSGGMGGGHDSAGAHVGVYFESAAVIVTFLLLGRLLEKRATARASSAVRALVEASPRHAVLVEREGRPLDPRRIPASRLRAGDVVRVRAGELVPADGRVRSGSISVDTSSMTGESVPRMASAQGSAKGSAGGPAEAGPSEGSRVDAGSVVVDGSAEVEALAVGRDTRLARMGRLVSEAQSKKAAIARLADRVSGVFVPVVLGIAALTLVGWWIGTGSFAHALGPAVAVLVIACPCALGLATPVALVAGSGRGAELGIYISGPQALEQASRLGAVLFDKTGTLTTGRMRAAAAHGEESALRLAGALESRSAHPIAQAVAAAYPAEAEVSDVRALGRGGVQGTVDGRSVVVGSPEALEAAGLEAPRRLLGALEQDGGLSRVLVAVDGEVTAALGIADTVREDARETVARLQDAGLAVFMLTGDHEQAALRVAEQLGIPAENVRAGLLPEDKVAEVERIRAERGRAVMVGDGLNDAAALATADLGISLTTGTDAARGASDITVLGERLSSVPTALGLARATLRTVKANLAWAFAYNVIGIPVAAAGLLSPMFAGAAMALSSVIVVANSLRLRRWRPKG
ncbi:heavy metal translocating P-type ATPase [Arthrobacter sp. UM1]|uniref:heavy metal translocating P-type ATPase n=1 Tax=Arthrobacter sp. UM1 TaxID=2766776 RepID=UPI001CF682D9|nr:cation-translocating P-type ATPase [Arthrobacter sp. UM1]MCB4209118.1 cation-translocating P-type ATPase [Arthrobacter sp. UM1]